MRSSIQIFVLDMEYAYIHCVLSKEGDRKLTRAERFHLVSAVGSMSDAEHYPRLFR